MTTTNMSTNVGHQLKEFVQKIQYQHLIAGTAGGVTSTLLLQPLDVIKIRFAAHDGRKHVIPRYSGIVDAFRTILKQEGVTGLYRGVTPNVIGAGSSWGLYFFFYNALKLQIQKGNLDMPLGAGSHLAAASLAGAVTLVFTNPIWVCKTRLCLQFEQKPQNTYKGLVDCLVKIYQKEGIRGYYRGFVPGLFGVSHGAVNFMVYEELKNSYNKYYEKPISNKLGTLEYLSFAAISKFIAAGATYPYQVIRTRLQNQYTTYNGTMDCVSQTWIYEGWRGFYKGLGTNLTRVVPATMITFLTYENVSHFIANSRQSN